MRVGARVLLLLSVPLNVHVLRALEDEPRSAAGLRRSVGSPPPTTLRCYTRALAELGVLERQRGDGFAASVDYELTAAGHDLLAVADALQRWLGKSPDGPVALGSTAAKSAIKALVEAWSTNIIRALAARPLSLTELDRLLPEVNYPSLERRLAAMRHAGLAEVRSGNRRGTPYGATDWLRRSTTPLVGAAGWEQRHAPSDTPPIRRVDVEAAFLLTVPLLRLPAELSGRCRLVVELRGRNAVELAGVTLEVAEGRIVSCAARLDGYADAWASGTPLAWMERLFDGSGEGLEIGGDWELIEGLLTGFQSTPARAF